MKLGLKQKHLNDVDIKIYFSFPSSYHNDLNLLKHLLNISIKKNFNIEVNFTNNCD
jgi:hypothetical protein